MTAQGRQIIESLETAGMFVTAATLPVEGSCCFVRHAPRSDAWPGPWPWQQDGAAAGGGAGGAGAGECEEIGYLIVVIDGQKCAQTLPSSIWSHLGKSRACEIQM